MKHSSPVSVRPKTSILQPQKSLYRKLLPELYELESESGKDDVPVELGLDQLEDYDSVQD